MLTTSCQTGSKYPEPNITLCRILDERTLFCVPIQALGEEFEVPIEQAIGYGCMSPDDEGKAMKHHMDLHHAIKNSSR